MSRAKQLFSVPSVPVPTSTNREGYAAYDRDLEEQFLQVLLTNTLGNTYYADSKDLLKEASEIHELMIKKDPEFAAKAIIFARNKGFMRLQPLLALSHLSLMDDPEETNFARAFEQTVLIPSDLQDFMTIISGQNRGQGGRSIKRSVNKFLIEKMSEYWAIKYNGDGRGYSLGDIIKTTHPKAKDELQNQLFNYLIGKDGWRESEHSLPQIEALDWLRRAETDEERIHWIENGKLPHEVVTSAVAKPSVAVWEAIMKQMPIFALLRNLNTLDRHGVLEKEENVQYVIERLTDEQALVKSKILPFQFMKAFNAVTNHRLKDAIRVAVEKTFTNMPDIDQSTAIFLDVSNSMWGRSARAYIDQDDYLKDFAGVAALSIFKKTGGKGILWLFNRDVYNAAPSMIDSIVSQSETIVYRRQQLDRQSPGTDCSKPILGLIEKKIKVDTIFIITDEQQNVGTQFQEVLNTYRRHINRNAKCIVINVSPEPASLISPEDKLSVQFYGWSDQVVKNAILASQGFGTMVDDVRRIEM